MMCLRAAVPRVGRAARLAVRRGHRKSRRVLTLGLPTVWGAVAITYKLSCPLAQQNGLGARVASSAVFFAVGTGLIVHVRRALLRELRQARQVAGAAQSAVLRPLPPRIDGLTVAAAQMSADRGATIGGDLYEAVATEHGVRVVMGDVRGHGLTAIGTAAAVLGSFREAVHDEPELTGVLRRLDRALARHLRERAEHDGTVAEEFVTVLLLEIGRDGGLHALNCGHLWPYLLSGPGVEPLSCADPLPPLGPFFGCRATFSPWSAATCYRARPWSCTRTVQRTRGTLMAGSLRCRRYFARLRGALPTSYLVLCSPLF